MDENKRIDTAGEPVQPNDSSDFMDTGVLHEPLCTNSACEQSHPHPKKP